MLVTRNSALHYFSMKAFSHKNRNNYHQYSEYNTYISVQKPVEPYQPISPLKPLARCVRRRIASNSTACVGETRVKKSRARVMPV